jgi:hypothetical protein
VHTVLNNVLTSPEYFLCVFSFCQLCGCIFIWLDTSGDSLTTTWALARPGWHAYSQCRPLVWFFLTTQYPIFCSVSSWEIKRVKHPIWSKFKALLLLVVVPCSFAFIYALCRLIFLVLYELLQASSEGWYFYFLCIKKLVRFACHLVATQESLKKCFVGMQHVVSQTIQGRRMAPVCGMYVLHTHPSMVPSKSASMKVSLSCTRSTRQSLKSLLRWMVYVCEVLA